MSIYLVGLRDSDIHVLHDLINQEEVRGNLFQDGRYRRESEIADLLYDTDPGTTTHVFGIIKPGMEELRGCIALNNVNHRARCGNVTHLAVKDWRTGLDAARAVVKHGFDTLNLHRIECRAYKDNRLTPLLVRKMGGKLDGIIRECVYREGTYHDICIWSILRKEWINGGSKAG